jgi:hypothetical protein
LNRRHEDFQSPIIGPILGLNMTIFDPSTDLPSSVNSDAKLLAFAALANRKMYGASTYTEVEGQAPANIITASIFRTDDGNYPDRIIGRFAIPLIAGWDTSNLKLFELVEDMGSVANWPAEFKA